ncbi:MAG TPA: hypothetical protein VEB21_20325 [Terriglobales bacterium]|nr:hypothetical protein [Terriglobales bacterium]
MPIETVFACPEPDAVIQLINAGAAAASAFAALAAVRLTVRMHERNALQNSNDRRRRLFDILIVDHAIDTVIKFMNASTTHFASEVAKLCRMADDAEQPHKDVLAALQHMMTHWNEELYYPLSRTLLARIDAWDDAALRANVRTQLEALQDAVGAHVERLILHPDNRALGADTSTRCVQILRTILAADPQAEDQR